MNTFSEGGATPPRDNAKKEQSLLPQTQPESAKSEHQRKRFLSDYEMKCGSLPGEYKKSTTIKPKAESSCVKHRAGIRLVSQRFAILLKP